MKILFLTRYGELGASSRLRSLQYLRSFRSLGWTVEVSALFSNAYLECLYTGKPRIQHVLKGYLGRLVALTRVHYFDLLIIEKEIFPYIPAWFEKVLAWRRIRYVVDYDDAIFHSYDENPRYLVRNLLGKKIDQVMTRAALVTAGNEYIANRARIAGARKVEIIPTVVDTERYVSVQKQDGSIPIVGWIGTPKTSRYLQQLLPVFEKLSNETSVLFVAVGANEADFAGTVVKVWPWAEESEVQAIQQFDIGVMPLTDSPWARGKCGYKLIQCMACGKPVVASPVGVNVEIVEHGENGYLANTQEEWYRYLLSLVHDSAGRFNMGQRGRQRVLDHYSVRTQINRYARLIEDVAIKK